MTPKEEYDLETKVVAVCYLVLLLSVCNLITILFIYIKMGGE